MTGHRHALYVAWGFPPAKSGGVFRMMETANVLVEQGWDVTVLACDIDDLRRYAGVDLSTLEGVDDRIRVVRIPMELGPFETDLYRWDESRVDDPVAWRAAYQRRVDAGFPNSVYSLWEEPLLEAAREVHAERPVDLVIASGGPFVCFSAGRELRMLAGVPYVLDYRDSWSLQQFTDERLHGPGSRVHEVEERLLRDAVEVWFVNEPMREWHEEVYPGIVGKTRVVTNGYDAAALVGVPPPQAHDGPIRFGYLGTVTAAVPLTETLEGYRRARAVDPTVAGSTFDIVGYLGFYHTPNDTIRAEILAAADDGVAWRGALPKAEVGTAYGQMDALVLTFGGTRYVTSGKVFEYMATGRPIVSVHAPENAVRDVLTGYPLWFQAASLQPDDVAAAFIAAAEAVRTRRAHDPDVVAACLAHAERFERRACLRPAIRDLEETAAFARSTHVVTDLDADVVAWVGGEVPRELRSWVARSGRRLVTIDPAAEDGLSSEVPSPGAPRLAHAEPGTLDGRLSRLYALLATPSGGDSVHADGRDDPAGDPGLGAPGDVDFEGVLSTAVRVLTAGAGAVVAGSAVAERVADLCRAAVPGLRAVSATDVEVGRVELTDLLGHPPAARLRAPQEPVIVTDDPQAADPPPAVLPTEGVTGATTARADGPADLTGSTGGDRDGGGSVLLSSRAVDGGLLELAEALALRSAREVLLLAPSTPGAGPRSEARRRDSRCGRVRIIRLPLPEAEPPGETGQDPDWRRRDGLWRERVVTVRAPDRLRRAVGRFGTRARARQARGASPVDPLLVAGARVGSAGVRALDAADDVVESAGRGLSDLRDRVDVARRGVPSWSDLYPGTRHLQEVFLPLVDRLDWDVLHVVDPAAADLARIAVGRRRDLGRPARWVHHLPPTTEALAGRVTLRERAALEALVAAPDAERAAPLLDPLDAAEPHRPERPWSRATLPASVGIGARNMAGQGWAWAKALERAAPGARTEVVALDRGSHLSYPADVVVGLETYNTDHVWMREFESHVLDTWTHALLEGGRPILGALYGTSFVDEAVVLADAGITVGLLFHGSDIRDPAAHVGRTPWSPFGDAGDSLVRTLQRRRDALAAQCRSFSGPMWVSTPDLLADLPGSTWLPVVVDAEIWASGAPVMDRRVPVVVHAPSRSSMKGSDAIEAALGGLRQEGLIDYRRVEGVAPDRMPEVIGSADIVLDQFAIGSYGVAAVEAMAAGRVVVGHVMDEVRATCPGLPVVEATPSTIDEVLRGLLADRERAREIAQDGAEYAARVHDGRLSGSLLVERLRPVTSGASGGRLGPLP